jgi:RNA polymerase sigma-70 factor (ECF subfamily)
MEDLSRRLANGDPTAFAELYDLCGDRLYRYLVMRLGSRSRASDVLQETFLRLVRARDNFRKIDNPVAYSFAAARNEADRSLKKGRSHEQLPADDLLIANDVDGSQAIDAAESVSSALRRLEPDLREVVELKHYADLTLREIAEMTGVPQGTAATRYRAAIQRLREVLMREWI